MLIGFVGFAGAGKGTASEILISDYGYEPDSYAKPLKDALAAMFSWPRDLLEGDTKEGRAWRERVDAWWAEKLGIPDFTPRMAMQNFGTNVIRRHFNDNMWTLSLERRFLLRDNPNVVVTDCRFPNEIELLRNLGGKIVRVKQGPEPEWWDLAISYNTRMRQLRAENPDTLIAWDSKVGEWDCPPIHISEWAWIGIELDLTINNEGTIDELYSAVREFVSLSK